jgi:hypothetical protein
MNSLAFHLPNLLLTQNFVYPTQSLTGRSGQIQPDSWLHEPDYGRKFI